MEKKIIGLSLVLLSITMWSAQEPAYRISVNTSLLALDAVVKDSSNSPVLDLKQDDFEIYEDGQLQPIRYFAVAEVPRSTMLIFDRSESVENQDKFILQAVGVFAKTMRSFDRISIFSFSEEFEIRLKWQNIGNGELPVKLPPTKPWSAIYDAIGRAGKRFDNEKGRRGIVVLTDGHDSGLLGETRRLGGVIDIAKDSSFQGFLEKLRKQSIPIYFVALRPNPYSELAYLNSAVYRGSHDYSVSSYRSETVGEDYVAGARKRMEKIAEVTGGRVLVPAALTDLASFYERIGRELGESYSLGYTPPNDAGGKYRRIEVRVRRSGVKVTQSRDGYQP